MTSNRRKKLLKKATGKSWFFTDDNTGTEFYMGETAYHDISIAAYDTVNKTFREFLLDFMALKAVYQFSKGQELHATERFVDKTYKPPLVKFYTTKDKMTLIKHQSSAMYGASVLAKIADFTVNEDEVDQALLLKRVAYLPKSENSILGVDTLAIPLSAADALIEAVLNKYREVEGVELDLESGGE